MLRILADDHYMTMTLDYLALIADFLYGRLYFHGFYHLSLITEYCYGCTDVSRLEAQFFARHVILPFDGS